MEQRTQAERGIPLSSGEVRKLIKKIQGGDRSALATLYDGTSSLLFGVVLRVWGDKASAEETLLDVYTHVWKQPASCDPTVPPLEWLLGIARARALARLRWSKPDKGTRERTSAGLGLTMTVAPEQQELARSSIESLVPTQREILEWAYYSGLSCGEIAAQAGKPLGAVKTHARQGLSKLGESLRPLLERETH